MKIQNEKVIEVPTIRLSVDETRAIMRAQQNGKTSIGSYGAAGLVDLGIMRKIVTNKDTPAKRAEAWGKVKVAVAKRDYAAASTALESVLVMNRKDKEFAYELTPLGKQVARGIAVKLSAQYGK